MRLLQTDEVWQRRFSIVLSYGQMGLSIGLNLLYISYMLHELGEFTKEERYGLCGKN